MLKNIGTVLTILVLLACESDHAKTLQAVATLPQADDLDAIGFYSDLGGATSGYYRKTASSERKSASLETEHIGYQHLSFSLKHATTGSEAAKAFEILKDGYRAQLQELEAYRAQYQAGTVSQTADAPIFLLRLRGAGGVETEIYLDSGASTFAQLWQALSKIAADFESYMKTSGTFSCAGSCEVYETVCRNPDPDAKAAFLILHDADDWRAMQQGYRLEVETANGSFMLACSSLEIASGELKEPAGKLARHRCGNAPLLLQLDLVPLGVDPNPAKVRILAADPAAAKPKFSEFSSLLTAGKAIDLQCATKSVVRMMQD